MFRSKTRCVKRSKYVASLNMLLDFATENPDNRCTNLTANSSMNTGTLSYL